MSPHDTSLALLAMDFPPTRGGIQTLTVEIYARLADLISLAVAPAAPGQGSAAPQYGLPLVRARRPAGPGWATLAYLREGCQLLRGASTPALLHCNHLFAGYAARWLRWRYGWRYAVWLHGEELGKIRNHRLATLTLSGASLILTNSEFTAALVRHALGRRRAPPLVVVPLGAPAAWIAAPLPPARAAGTAPTRPPVILTVARLLARDRYKGIDTSLAAMAELRRRGRAFQYWIAGDGDDRGYLEDHARRLGIEDVVRFLGPVPDGQLMALYDACDVFLLCSREEASVRGLGFEGFGIVLLEANARGKPVVGGHSGGVPDAVADGVSGLLVAPRSPVAVADGLEKLLLDPELRQRLGAQGRARVRSRYNWDNAAAVVRAAHLATCAELAVRP